MLAWIRLVSRNVTIVGALALAAGAGAGCKQGLGERCQIDDDCAGDLVCSTAENVCDTTKSGSTVDAAPPDVREPDAVGSGLDAGTDAPPVVLDADLDLDAPLPVLDASIDAT